MRSPIKKLSVGILGGKGMLGSDLAGFLEEHYVVKTIDKDTYEEGRKERYDIFINANGNSKRFWANEHPFEDFEASTVSVYKSLCDFQFKKYIYISSSDVYENHSRPVYTKEDQHIRVANLSSYGFHKYVSEQIVQHVVPDYLILRSSLLLGSNLVKGPIYDILYNYPLFITFQSALQMITTKEIASIIILCVEKNITKEIINTGGRGAFPFSRMREYVKTPLTVSPDAKTQLYEMDTTKLAAFYPLKTSEEYLKKFIYEYAKK